MKKTSSTLPARVLATGLALASFAAAWMYLDYRAWLKLGSGGLPSSFGGWVQTSIWRLQKTDPFDTRPLQALTQAKTEASFLTKLPARATARPRVGPHPVPHRQIDQRAPAHLISALQVKFDKAVEEHSAVVGYALSHFERHTKAVTSLLDSAADPVRGASHGEIGHIHEVDGSMHMILSPSDAIAAIEGGWAEKHGLAGGPLRLPATYMLVYAPQTEADVEASAHLLRAAIGYMTGRG